MISVHIDSKKTTDSLAFSNIFQSSGNLSKQTQVEMCPDGPAAERKQIFNLSCMWVLVRPGAALAKDANVDTT